MKKIIGIFAIAVTLVAAQGHAQTRDRSQIGLKAGANYSNVYDSKGEAFNADAKFGFAGGLFFSIPIGKFLGVQPEVLFSQKGFQASGKILGNAYSFTRTTNYLDVPLLIAIKPIEYLTILVGPQYSYLFKQKDVFENSSITIDQEKEFTNDNIRKNTLGFVGGADINVVHFVLGLRAGWDVQNNNGDGTSITPRYRNAWYQATVGYRF
jgi:Outer membrane protein beta-barrel domain